MDVYCERIIAVLADRENRMERIMRRDGIGQDEAELRMAAQYDEAFFIDRCDDILVNNGDTEALSAEVRRYYERLVRDER